MGIVIYHNPACSKSRATLALLRDRGLHPTVIEYLTNPPSADQIREIMRQIDRPAGDLLRKGEAIFADSGLSPDTVDPDEIAHALAACPRLMQRPIVVANGKARLGRPPECVIDIL